MDIGQVEISVPALVEEARSTSMRGDPVETAIAWGLCRLTGQGGAEAVYAGARALSEQGRSAEAELVLADGVDAWPEAEPILADYCWAAHQRRDWLEAARRWTLYRQRFPAAFLGYGIGCAAWREAGDFENADRVASIGLALFPNRAEMAGNYAWVPHRRCDWPEAERRWRAYIDAFPNDPIGYAAAGVALREMREFDAADSVLRTGLGRHSDHSELLGNYAWVAYYRQDWEEALRRWSTYRDRFPSDSLGHRQVMLVLGELGRFQEAQQLVRIGRGDGADEDTATLILRFESLGFNCEFGVVQRHFGAEPLGLLRFTATPWRLLRDALENRLEGVGEPENTTLTVFNGEYMTGDKRYHMVMHTFIREAGDDREKRFRHICQRLRFLRDKLICDLMDAEKIFVYACQDVLAPRDIQSFHEAMRKYGDGRLLLVQLVNGIHTAGECIKIRDKLAIGYLATLGVDNPDFAGWLTICQKAAQLLH
jgi:tetratricopeptide (TPR) repeat protein